MTAEVEKKAVDLGLLEEDDEFEEFPAKELDCKKEDQIDVNVWEDNWDDDAIEEDFSVQLSTFSRKRCHSRSPPLRSPEPVAKKMCSRATPPPPTSVPATSSPTSRSSRSSRNGVSNGVNGHAVNNNGSNETAGDSRNSSQQSASRESNNSNNESRTPTRSSARLRSGRK
jgi:26 proteasome complex subunit DSS1